MNYLFIFILLLFKTATSAAKITHDGKILLIDK